MPDFSTRVITVIRTELGEVRWLRVEAVHGDITSDTELADVFDGHTDMIDRVCVTCALDEAFGIELPDAALEGWATVGDVVASVAGLLPAETVGA